MDELEYQETMFRIRQVNEFNNMLALNLQLRHQLQEYEDRKAIKTALEEIVAEGNERLAAQRST